MIKLALERINAKSPYEVKEAANPVLLFTKTIKTLTSVCVGLSVLTR